MIDALASPRGIVGLAWANIAIHVVAMSFAALGMRPGTPAVPLEEQVSYLSGVPLGWTLGWGAWMGCALVNVFFVAALARIADRARGPAGAPDAWLGVILVAAAAAVDLLCDVVQILVVPAVARLALESGRNDLFVSVSGGAWAGGAIAANGLYSLGVLLVTLELARLPATPRAALPLGVATFAGGAAMTVAGFTGVARHLELASGATIFFFILWCAVVARAGRAAST